MVRMADLGTPAIAEAVIVSPDKVGAGCGRLLIAAGRRASQTPANQDKNKGINLNREITKIFRRVYF